MYNNHKDRKVITMNYNMNKLGNITVKYPVDCGNAPKKLLLKDFHVAVVQNDRDFISDNLTDDTLWKIIGDKEIEGKEKVTSTLLNSYQNVSKLEIEQIITHGKITSINGTVTYQHDKKLAFCHVHIFNNASKTAKIKETTSYLINI